MRRTSLGLLLITLLTGGAARAQHVEWGGELRLSAVAGVASSDQFGDQGTGPCGKQPVVDGGGNVSASGAVLIVTPRYRYQLTLGAGYYALVCTPSLRRPVAGLDYRGDHRFGARTEVTSSLHAVVDAFDRSLDIRSGVVNPNMPSDLSGLAAGTPYLTAGGALAFEHRVAGRSGIHAGMAVYMLELLAPVGNLNPYLTLGPAESLSLDFYPFRDTVRDRLELPLTYRVSHYYPASLVGVVGQWAVRPSQEVALRGAWEHRFSELWGLRLELGLTAAYQPNLCVRTDAYSITNSRCSIDPDHPGIRGGTVAPPLELALGRQATGTFVGQISLRRRTRRGQFELVLERLYDPSPWSGALVLLDRLAANGTVRLLSDLYLRGSAQVANEGGSSPGRVSGTNGEILPQVSPQNRSLYMTLGSVAMDWNFRGPLALFAETTWQAFAIRGEAVYQNRAMPTDTLQVSEFPTPTPNGGSYLSLWRVNFIVGLRVFLKPSSREANLLLDARPLP